ncbi:MAG: hypothetical protein L6W00_20965 [Lentisphaeria bacterium]|nr:MAG: hypothetical protein L6W00_20965 [Lentisphaeria bacterium]
MVFKPVFLLLTLCLLAGCAPERNAKTPQRLLSLSTAATHILTELELPPCAIDEYGRIAAGSPPPAVIGKGGRLAGEDRRAWHRRRDRLVLSDARGGTFPQRRAVGDDCSRIAPCGIS